MWHHVASCGIMWHLAFLGGHLCIYPHCKLKIVKVIEGFNISSLPQDISRQINSHSVSWLKIE
jgi:hypothetical protein